MINHRGPEFAAIMRECVDGVKWAFQTEHDVVILTASGTGGLESLVVNTLSPGDCVLVASIGNFGDRTARLARSYGVDAVQLDAEHGETVWSPAVGRLYAVQVGLLLMRDEGLDAIVGRHQRLAPLTPAGLPDLCWRLVAGPRFAAATVTAAYVPGTVNAEQLRTC